MGDICVASGEEEASRAMELAREVRALRTRDETQRRELIALQDAVAALAARLDETTGELAQRAQFAADAVAQMARLEGDAVAARRAVLSREMQLQDAAQQVRALETRLRSKEDECAHWEAEFQRVDALLVEQKRVAIELRAALDDKKRMGKQRKAQMQRLVAAMDEMKQHMERLQDKERRLTHAVEVKDADAEKREQEWATKVAYLQEQIGDIEEDKRCAEQNRSEQSEAHKIRESAAQVLQLEQSEQVNSLRSQLREMEQVVSKLRTKEQLFRREVCRLREELLLSESQRTTDQRRLEQRIRGKDKEVAFIWKKYVDLVSTLPRDDTHTPATGKQGSFISDPDAHTAPTD
jgi:hypothetical protein